MFAASKTVGLNFSNASISFIETYVNATDLTTYSTTSNIGTASSDRYVLIALASSNGASPRDISTVTIGGVTATLLKKALLDTGSNQTRIAAIYMAPIPTGTTAAVSVTFNAAMARFGMSVYRVTGLSSATPQDSVSISGLTGTSGNLSLTASAEGGIAVGAYYVQDATATYTWSGLTENADFVLENPGGSMTTASTAFTTSGSKTITVNSSVSAHYVGCSVYLT